MRHELPAVCLETVNNVHPEEHEDMAKRRDFTTKDTKGTKEEKRWYCNLTICRTR